MRDTLTFADACDTVADNGRPAIICWELERDTGIRTTLIRIKPEIERAQSISIIIGSEGGLTDAEVQIAIRRGH